MKKISYKNIVTIISVIFFMVILVIAYKNRSMLKSLNSNNSNDNYIIKNDNEEIKSNSNKKITKDEINIEQNQLYSMNTDVYMNMGDDFEYIVNIDNCYYSKKLDSKYEFKTIYKQRYGEDTFADNGDINSDYYYLYVDYFVGCTKLDNKFVSKSLLYIDMNNEVIKYDNNLDNHYIYLFDYDNKFSSENVINAFEIDTKVHFELVYLIPTNLIEEDDICIYLSAGSGNVKDIIGDSRGLCKFIKLDKIIQ